ncbi:MAG: ATP-binding protein, partial [Pseudomonadota bacterium]|nr:ATP-binding protein [Pseudomonadota bacterium]
MTACAKPATGGAPDISFLATPEQARHAVIHVIAGLADAGLEQGRLCDIELALAEVVNNIVEHGYAGLPAGAIRITCTHGRQCMHISVCDQGHCIPNGLPPGTAPNLDVPL